MAGLLFCPPFPWCQSSWSKEAIANATLCSFSKTNTTVACFNTSKVGIQKIRQCDQDETLFVVLLVGIVIFFNLASLLASLRLNRIINYVKLYKMSKSFLGFPTQPILHRSAVFQLVESKDTEVFDKMGTI